MTLYHSVFSLCYWNVWNDGLCFWGDRKNILLTLETLDDNCNVIETVSVVTSNSVSVVSCCLHRLWESKTYPFTLNISHSFINSLCFIHRDSVSHYVTAWSSARMLFNFFFCFPCLFLPPALHIDLNGKGIETDTFAILNYRRFHLFCPQHRSTKAFYLYF